MTDATTIAAPAHDPTLAAAPAAAATVAAAADPLLWLKQQNYRWGALAAVAYDRTRPDIFQPQPFLPYLYDRTRRSGRSSLGSLPALFCGMADLSLDAICSFLHSRLVLVLGEYRRPPEPAAGLDDLNDIEYDYLPDLLHPLGYAFPGTLPITTSADASSNSMFVGYTFFREAWRTPQQLLLTYLGLAFLFQEFRLEAIHGVRYADNVLTARWAAKFGFRDCGTLPSFMRDCRPGSDGGLTAATFSTLSRADFVERLRAVLLQVVAAEAEEGDVGQQGRESVRPSAASPRAEQHAVDEPRHAAGR